MTILGVAWQIGVTGVLLLAGIGLLDLWLTSAGCGECGNTGRDIDSGRECARCGGDGQLDDDDEAGDETIPYDPDKARDWGIADDMGVW